MESLESEIKFLELFGLTLEGPDNSNRYKVFDENKKEVGFIQKKKLHKKNLKKGLEATFGYITEIETDKIIFKNTRKIDNNNLKPLYLNDSRFYYEFEVKNPEGNEKATLSLKENPYINIWSNEYGFIDFRLDYNTMFLNFKSKTESYNIEETISVNLHYDRDQNHHQGQEYSYTLSYCDKNNNLEDKIGRTTNTLIARKDRYSNVGKIELEEVYWKDGEKIKEKTTELYTTVAEVIRKHKMGIESFNHFRHLINELIPSKKEIVKAMTESNGVNGYPFTLFIHEYKPKINLSKYNFIKEINENIKFAVQTTIEGNKKHHTSFIIYNDKEEVEFVNEYYSQKIDYNGYYSFKGDKVIRCSNKGTEEMSFDIKTKEINILSTTSKQYLQYNFDLSKFDEVFEITDGVKFAIKEEEVPSKDIHQWGYVIYDNKEVHNFEYIIALSPNNVGATGYYGWNEDYIIMFFEDGRVEKVFDIKNKNIIENYDEKEEIKNDYLKKLGYI